MPALVHHDPTDCFTPEQVATMARVIERAWDVVCHDQEARQPEDRYLLTRCVLNEARLGENNYTRLVNRSIAAFRRQRMHVLSTRRRTSRK
jgi:hypothetical protein